MGSRYTDYKEKVEVDVHDDDSDESSSDFGLNLRVFDNDDEPNHPDQEKKDDDITVRAAKKPCLVEGCRFSQDHLTSAHRCGKCWSYGHGYQQCTIQHAKDQLKDLINAQLSIYDDLIPKDQRCQIYGCKHKYSHKTSSHHCSYCGRRGHHTSAECRYRKNGMAPPPPGEDYFNEDDSDHSNYSDDDHIMDRPRERYGYRYERELAERERYLFEKERATMMRMPPEFQLLELLVKTKDFPCANKENPFHKCSTYCFLNSLLLKKDQPPKVEKRGIFYRCPICNDDNVEGIELIDEKDQYECVVCLGRYTDEKAIAEGFTAMYGLHSNHKIGHSVCKTCIVDKLNDPEYKKSLGKSDCQQGDTSRRHIFALIE